MAERGTVTQIAPLLVSLDSGDAAVPALRLTNYVPALNDRVAVDRLDSQLLCIGKVV